MTHEERERVAREILGWYCDPADSPYWWMEKGVRVWTQTWFPPSDDPRWWGPLLEVLISKHDLVVGRSFCWWLGHSLIHEAHSLKQVANAAALVVLAGKEGT